MTTDIVSASAVSHLTRRKASLEEFWALPESVLPAEYIDGEIIMAPTPTVFHQTIVGNIYFILRTFVEERKTGRIYPSPLDVQWPSGDVVQPDLFFLTNEEAAAAAYAKRVSVAPSFVVEILSPGSVEHDAVTKRALYEANGVREYWLVDPETDFVAQLVLTEGRYALTEVRQEATIRGAVLEGFETKVSQFFMP